MTEFLDVLLSSPSPLPLKITPDTSLQDIIAASFIYKETNTGKDSIDNSVTEPNLAQPTATDDGALVAALLADSTQKEQHSTKLNAQASYSTIDPLLSSKTSEIPTNIANSEPEKITKVQQSLHDVDSDLNSKQQKQCESAKLESYHPRQAKQLSSYCQYQSFEKERYQSCQEEGNTEKYQSLQEESTKERYQSLQEAAIKERYQSCQDDSIKERYQPYQEDAIKEKYKSYQEKATRHDIGGPIFKPPFDQQLYHAVNRLQMIADNLEQTVQDQTAINNHTVITFCQGKPNTTHHIETQRWTGLSPRSTNLMEEWYELNKDFPYPDKEVIRSIAKQCNITQLQICKWFSNKRNRSQNMRTCSADNLEQIVQDQRAINNRMDITFRQRKPNITYPIETQRRTRLSPRSINLMEEWYELNKDFPYPDKAEIRSMAKQCDISQQKISKWFSNKRNRMQNTRTCSTVRLKKMTIKYNKNQYKPY